METYPVIAEVIQKLRLSKTQPFKGWKILAVQHVHSSLIPLVDALLECGANEHDMIIVGKSYSTKYEVVSKLRRRGIHVLDPQTMRNPLDSYERQLYELVNVALDVIEQDSHSNLLVLDEGGVVSSSLIDRRELGKRTKLVEQTTRGARVLESISISFPAVDVARSQAKRTLESPIVARSMVSELQNVLINLNMRPRVIGIVGYGTMGSQVALLLKDDFQVLVCDLDDCCVRSAHDHGMKVVELDRILNEVEVVLGCTGRGVLTDENLTGANHSLALVNGASSDIEFHLWMHRRAENILPGSRGDLGRPWLNHYRIHSTRQHVLISGGFPINFHAVSEPLSPEEFQVTRALMLAGAHQAVHTESGGLVPLDQDIQKIITTVYDSLRRQRGF